MRRMGNFVSFYFVWGELMAQLRADGGKLTVERLLVP